MPFKIFDLGLVDFAQAWQRQKEIFNQVKNNFLAAGLILCQHYPVITLGRSADQKNILISRQQLMARGINIYAVERGGDVTYHGPGQLTVYPIFNLAYLKKDIHWFLRQLEDTVIDFLADFGLQAERQPALTGVWLGSKKIASIGVAIRNWVTFHGLTVNIKQSDLANFSLIRPCGMDIEMTSLEGALERSLKVEEIKDKLTLKFQSNFYGVGKYTPAEHK